MGIKSDVSRDRNKQASSKWAKIHTDMGCPGCKLAKPQHLLKRACCTFPGTINTDKDGKCFKRVSA